VSDSTVSLVSAHGGREASMIIVGLVLGLLAGWAAGTAQGRKPQPAPVRPRRR